MRRSICSIFLDIRSSLTLEVYIKDKSTAIDRNRNLKVAPNIPLYFTISSMRSLLNISAILATTVAASCPYMSGELRPRGDGSERRQSSEDVTIANIDFRAQFELNDTGVYMTTDSGTPIDDAVSLKAGIRGPTLLEDFIFRQKIQRFDHERVGTLLLLLKLILH
jgi:hypothetical protein